VPGHAPDDGAVKVSRSGTGSCGHGAVDAREPRAAHAVGAQRRALCGATAGAQHGARDGHGADAVATQTREHFVRTSWFIVEHHARAPLRDEDTRA
jgi:hypothetical protein